MGFVHGEEIDIPSLEVLEEAGEHESFGSGIEEAIIALMKAAKAGTGFAGGQGGVEECGGNAGGLEGVHLVFHQGDQGGNDDGQAGAEECGELEAEGFAAAGGEEGQDIAAGDGFADDLALERAEGGEAKVALEQSGPGMFVRVHAVRGVLTFMAGMMEK
jgi:hypothetical protein